MDHAARIEPIQYLDGSTTATPLARSLVAARRADLRVLERASIPTARLLAALSTALDLTEGQLPGHALRTCYLAMRLADDLGLDAADRGALFFAALLKDAGCSSNAAAITRIFGADDIATKAPPVHDRAIDAGVRGVLDPHDPVERAAAAPAPADHRARGPRATRASRDRAAPLRARAAIARKAGFDDRVAGAILDLHEHWDGGGDPRGLRGAEIHPLARILAACQGLDVFLSTQGRPRALSVVAERLGSWYDPDVAEALLDGCTRGFLDELAAPDLVGRTMALEPGGDVRLSDDADIDRIASAFADIVDAKSPYTGSHSKRVADIGEGLAVRLGLAAPEVVDVRRAGLLHDLGKLGVPNTVLDKPGRLDASELEVIRRHPELTLRILAPVPTFTSVAELAACHHERLDGTGYFRGLTAPGARDRRADRGRRRRLRGADGGPALSVAMSTGEAFELMRASAGEHLAADVIEALTDTVA